MNDTLTNIMQEEQKQKQTVDINQIKRTIAYAEKHIKIKGSPQHCVILMGNTGAGKSATVTILNGQQIYGFKQDNVTIVSNIKDKIEREAVKQKIKQKKDKEEAAIFIEDKPISGTAYPAHLEMKGDNVVESVDLWDTAGSGDTKGITQILINTYFIHRLFNILPSVKLFFTIHFAHLSSDKKGSHFKEITKSLTHALAKFVDYQNSMGLLITKVPPGMKQSKMHQLLLQNMKHLGYLQKEKDISIFFKHIREQRIKIVIVQQPDVQISDTPQNPKNVTFQYKKFVDNFYNVVTKQLQAAKFPSLEAPGMSQSEIMKCEQFLQTTITGLRSNTNDLKVKLRAYTLSKLNIQSFSLNKDKNQQIMLSIANTTLFVRTVKQISTKKLTSIQELNKNYDALTTIFQSSAHRFECKLIEDKLVCQPMKKIKDLNIIVDFLSGVNLSQKMRYSCRDSLIQFFNVLGGSIIEIDKEINDEIKKILGLYQRCVVGNLTRHYESWRREQLFQQWIKNLRVVPGLYLRARKFFKNNSNFMDYLNELQTMEREVQMKCPEDLAPIMQIYKYSKDVADLNIDQAGLIRDIKKQCSTQETDIRKFLADIWISPSMLSSNTLPQNQNKNEPQNPAPSKGSRICPCCSLI